MWSGRVGRRVSGKKIFWTQNSSFMGGGVFFYKLTRNPNLTKNFFFFVGGRGGVKGGGGGVYVHEQMF